MLTKLETCPACGQPIDPKEPVRFEVIIDPSVRFLKLHQHCTTYVRTLSNAA